MNIKIMLSKIQNLKMYQGNTYIGSIFNFNEDEIEIEINKIIDDYYISVYHQGLSLHFWCTKYTVEEMNENESENN